MKNVTNKIIVLLLALFILSCSTNNSNESQDDTSVESTSTNATVVEEKQDETPQHPQAGKVRFEVEESEHGGYGYKIFNNDKLYINQPMIPSVAGIKGFETKEDAQKVANLVVEKINNGIMPPAVTEEELKKLNIKL
jgi:hypothetical protein